MSTTITPYLFFSGRCEEALNFYKQALGAQIEMVMRFNESPEPTPPGMLQAGFESKIMHASFHIGEVRMMASDGCDDKSKFDGFRLAFGVPSESEAHKAFDALAEEGKVEMPLCKTFGRPATEWLPTSSILAGWSWCRVRFLYETDSKGNEQWLRPNCLLILMST